VKRFVILLAAAFVAAGCASQADTKTVMAKKVEDVPACKATPKELVVKDIQAGEGRELIPRASVMVQYTGWLYDGCKADLKGTQFDSSRDKPVPFGFMVGAGRVIKGWDEGVVGMKEKGAKRLLIIPPDKAYGEKGVGERIPPNSALVFEIETVQIGYYPPAAGPVTK
jgi:FKBP-type peptidyl-prolyl cis-trans isomerase